MQYRTLLPSLRAGTADTTITTAQSRRPLPIFEQLQPLLSSMSVAAGADQVAMDSLTEWRDNFNSQFRTMRDLMLLRTRPDDEASRQKMLPAFKAAADALAELEKSRAALNAYIAAEQAQAQEMAEVHRLLTRQAHRMALMRAHLPGEVAECLGLETSQDAENDSAKGNHDSSNLPRTPAQARTPAAKTSLPPRPKSSSKPKVTRKRNVRGSSTAKPKPTNSSNPPASPNAPVVQSVSPEQLSNAPQYVKGRLTVEKIDTVVARLNEIASAKYALMSRTYGELSSMEAGPWQDFKDNECEDTKGKLFLTDGEIKGFGEFRMDSTVKSVINILRHVGSLKEIRGKAKARIFIIN